MKLKREKIKTESEVAGRPSAREPSAENNVPFRVICDQLPIGMFITEADGSLVYLNQFAQRDLSLEEGKGRGWVEVIHPAGRERVVSVWEKSVHDEGTFESIHRTLLRDGRVNWLHVKAVPIQEWDRILWYAGTIEDITQRMQAQEKASESHSRLTRLLSNLSGYAYRCRNDKDWTLDFISDGVFEVTGYTAKEYLVNRTITCGTRCKRLSLRASHLNLSFGSSHIEASSSR